MAYPKIVAPDPELDLRCTTRSPTVNWKTASYDRFSSAHTLIEKWEKESSVSANSVVFTALGATRAQGPATRLLSSYYPLVHAHSVKDAYGVLARALPKDAAMYAQKYDDLTSQLSAWERAGSERISPSQIVDPRVAEAYAKALPRHEWPD